MALWIRTDDNAIVNLDQARSVDVIDILDAMPGEPEFALEIAFPDENSAWITSGTKEHCQAVQGALINELSNHQEFLAP